jgi:signal transduction histidine kinase/CheY-like chemotaxis protein
VRVLRSKAPVLDIRHAVEWPNGRRKVLSINGSPILDERGEVRQLVFALVDLTEQTREARAREQMRNQVEQLTRLESLSVLAGGVAHDFNNLLVGVLGGAELALLTMTPGTPEHLHVERIIESANRAAELTRQLLAYSGKGRFEVGALDLSVVVEGTRKLLGSLVRKDVALALHLDRRLPAVEADPTQLRQILMNLVLNGTQAIVEGTRGTIDIRTGVIDADEEYLRKTVPLAAQPKPGTYAFVEVSDNGCGLDPALIGRIFEPFYSTKPGGHGLGLAAVLGIAQGHRGFVEVRSTLGQGTTIRLGLPARPDLRALQPTAPPGAAAEPTIKYTVLLVDDEAMVRNVTNTILQRAGASTILAEDGAAALKLAADPALRIDFAVIDMSMPGMRGDQLLLELRKQRPQLPAVLMSGYSGDQGGRSEPNTRFLSKPFRRQELLDCLEAMLNLKV